MITELQLDKMNDEELRNWLINAHEKYYIEMKKAQELPRAFWESYSSFCNTEGGWIILGLIEKKPFNEIGGVANAEKTEVDLWSNLSNEGKISYRAVDNHDVSVRTIDGKNIVLVHIKEAPTDKKPVYIDGKIENSYIRTGDGDRKATKEEIAAFLRNAHPIMDSLPAEKFTLEDLDDYALISFKEKVSKRYPKKRYQEKSNCEFLQEIGAAYIDRNTGEYKLYKGTILFLGKVNSIRELYPQYHVDYFNRRGNNDRWTDRVTDDELGDDEMNLYNFYTIVYDKLKNVLHESFELDSDRQMRLPLSDYDLTIRESLVNCLSHADYEQGFPTVKIEAYDGWFRFLNPGRLLITKEQFFIGGDSRPRNEKIFKLFRLLGVSERQGFGGRLLIESAVVYDFRKPEIITNLEKTELTIWNIDLADSYPELSGEIKNVYRFIAKSRGEHSVKEMQETLHITEYKTRKALEYLVDKGMIERHGNSSATRYSIANDSIEKLTQMQLTVDKRKKEYVSRKGQ